MSRRDVEELIKQLQDAAKDSHDRVTLERAIFDEVVANLGRLEQALDNRPSLIKKLNEKIIKLEGELEILRNETRVNELERKVQRLEGELQRSYATKNFTLKNGLLEIEKAYRDFISGSPAVQCLWDEITLLLVEDKEVLPQHILQRRNTTLRVQEIEQPSVTDSPLGPQVAEDVSAPGSAEPHHNLSYVQQQVDKFKDYTFTPGTHDPHDPNHPANLNATYSAHHFPGGTPAASLGGAPDARAGEIVDDRPTGLDDKLTRLREHYNESGGSSIATPAMEPHWGSVVPAPSPLRPVSLFSPGGDGRLPDASALGACRDELNASLEHLRALFAQYDWAPTPLPGTAAAIQQGGQQHEERRLPDASAFTSMADSLEVSVERLRQYFGAMQWLPVGVPPGGSKSARVEGGPFVPDASYFNSQADVILASVQHLRQQFQEAAAAAAAETAVPAAPGGSTSSTVGGGASTGAGGNSPGAGGAAAASIIPDARYFETQADVIAASVNELLRLYEQSAAAAAGAAADSGGGNARSLGPWGSATAQAEVAVSGDMRPAINPDARARDEVQEEFDASVQPLVDLFSSFMAHLQATRGSPGASGPWPLWLRQGKAPVEAAGSGGSTGDLGGSSEDKEELGPAPDTSDLIRMFAKYARSWPVAMVAAPVLHTHLEAAAAAAGVGDGSSDSVVLDTALRTGGAGVLPDTWPLGGSGAGAPATMTLASSTPAVRFRITVNATDAGGSVTAHMSPSPSSASLTDRQPHQQLLQRQPEVTNVENGTITEGRAATTAPATAACESFSGRSPAPTAGPLGVLLASLESRHGHGLANSPEAVAVWRDLLSLLGVDPNSRPLPSQEPPLFVSSRSSGASGTTGLSANPWQKQSNVVSDSDTGDGTSRGPAAATAWAAGSVNDHMHGAGEPVLPAAVSASSGGRPMRRSTSATGGRRTEDGSVSALGSCLTNDGSTVDGNMVNGNPEGVTANVRELMEKEGTAEPGTAEADTAKRTTITVDTEGSALISTAAAQAQAVTATARRTGEADSQVHNPDASAAPRRMTKVDLLAWKTGSDGGQMDGLDGVDTGVDDRQGGNAADAVSHSVLRNNSSSRSGNSQTGAAAMSKGIGSDMATAAGNVDEELTEAESLYDHGHAGRESEPVDTLIPAPTIVGGVETGDVEGPGLIAGGVRFQITLSEITPADGLQPISNQPQLQTNAQPVQFRANVNGMDLEQAAAAEAELAQLREAHQGLSEKLTAAQELVLVLNRQLAITLESRDDLAARVEAMVTDLSAARADAAEARHESDMFMRELVEAKVQLAEVQGEYMQVYMALKKALGNEKDMIAKIDELERILAVVGPGDVSVDDEYGSTVGQASAMVTPREDYIGGGANPGALKGHQPGESGGASPSPGVGAGYGPDYHATNPPNGDGGRLERHTIESRSVEHVSGGLFGGLRGTSSGSRSSSGGGGSRGSGGGASAR